MTAWRRGAGVALWAVLVWTIGVQAQAAAGHSAAQDIYDRGQAAYDKADWAEAARDFVQLLPSTPISLNGRSQSVIAYRYADSLVRLGRAPEAQPWIEAAVTGLASAEPELAADAWMVKGDVDRAAFEYPAAMEDYLRADALVASKGLSEQLVEARLGAGEAGATVDPKRVLPGLAALMVDPTFATRIARPVRARVEDIASRAAVNLGDLPTATRLSHEAVRDSGGLTGSASVSQIATRADAAIVARLGGRDEDAREYLTYTGAGHLDDMDWIPQHTGELPLCGEPTGDGAESARPNDSVVVAFAISDQGVVEGAAPIYASRLGRIGEAFVRAVADWRWDPVAISRVPLFWRSTLQLELRCQSRPELDDFFGASRKAVLDRLNADGLLTPVEFAYASQGGGLDISSSDPRMRGPEATLLAVATHAPGNSSDIEIVWGKLDRIHAPPVAYAAAVENLANNACQGLCDSKGPARRAAAILGEWTPRFLQRFPGDPAGERLLMAESLDLEAAGDFNSAQPILVSLTRSADQQGATLTSLHALAYLHRAIGLQHEGDEGAARAMLQRSGLNSSTCAVFDTHPLAQTGGPSSFSFPNEALRWQFNRFVLTDFNIRADGHVDGVRAVIAYPPFIFDQASVAGVRRFTYIAPRLGGEALGCQGETREIRFKAAS